MIPSGILGRTVLVTGAAGFIGSHLCQRLAAMGVAVHAVSRSLSPGQSGSVTRNRCDLADLAATRSLLRRCRPDIIIHLAGLAAAARDPGLVLPTFQSNLAATVNLLTAAQEFAQPRVVLPGSLEEPEHLDHPRVHPDAVASSPYAISKWCASEYGRMFHRLYGLPVTIGRIFMAYGPTARDLHKLIPYVILSLLDGQAPRLSSGRRELDWIHVDDVVSGLLALADAPGAVGQTLDIGSGTRVSIRDLVARIVELSGPPPEAAPIFDPALDRPFEQTRVARVQATQSAIGWRPAVTLNQGLAATVEWFQRHRRPSAVYGDRAVAYRQVPQVPLLR